MALVALPYPVILMPESVASLSGVGTTAGSSISWTMNGAGDKVAWIFQAQSTTPPDAIKFNVNTYTSSGTLDFTLETVATDGFPSGTAVSGSATVSKTVSASGYQITATGMAGSASLTAGTEYAIVATATGGFAGNFGVAYSYGSNSGIGLPYAATKESAGGWSKVSTTMSGWCVGAVDASNNVLPLAGIVGGFHAYAFVSYHNGSATDEYGTRFVPTAPCRVIGAAYFCTWGSAPGTTDAHTVKLLSSVSSGGTPTEERTYVAGGGVQASSAFHMCRFGSSFDCAAGSSYGLTIKADSTDTANLIRWTFNANADLASFTGVDNHEITRNNAGTVTYASTIVSAIFPIISHIDDGTGGSGGILVHPGMGGGMRG